MKFLQLISIIVFLFSYAIPDSFAQLDTVSELQSETFIPLLNLSKTPSKYFIDFRTGDYPKSAAEIASITDEKTIPNISPNSATRSIKIRRPVGVKKVAVQVMEIPSSSGHIGYSLRGSLFVEPEDQSVTHAQFVPLINETIASASENTIIQNDLNVWSGDVQYFSYIIADVTVGVGATGTVAVQFIE